MSQNQVSVLGQMREAILRLDLVTAKELCEEALTKNIAPLDVLENAMYPGLQEIGRKYEEGEYFLPELIAAGEIITEVMKILEPFMRKEEAGLCGKVVIGSVRGDIHDIGKSILSILVSGAGTEVVDLGVDVSDERFVEATRKIKPSVVGLSALLTTTMTEMKTVIDALNRAGLREDVRVIVGGRPVSAQYANEIGADAYGEDALKGRDTIQKWLQIRASMQTRRPS
jgi:corrinoid protein of di/trimethylamine methyltransferase